ncbi:DUF58 domain-containing protein [Allohahella marinimesophila]|uniref:DUF58 domain-containing protein n=1 Tax=Allohahella marinimesophila TaxID=1054972 RepID=A0ABP7QBK4_9GAMM
MSTQLRDRIDLLTMLGLQPEARSLTLKLDPRKVPGLTGSHRSHLLGRGMTFAEHRPYQAGDDIRHIDWRVSARSQHTYSKVFQEETQQPVQLLVDQRSNMYFGSNKTFKSVVAAELSALLTWAGLANNDRVGGLVFDDVSHQHVKPAQHKRQTVRIFDVIDRFNARLCDEASSSRTVAASSLNSALDELTRLSRPGTLCLLISDFEGLLDELPADGHVADQPVSRPALSCEQILFRLRRHNQIFAFLVYDPLELALPGPSLEICNSSGDRLTLPERQAALDDINLALRERHEAKIRKLEALKCIVVPISTAEDPAEVLRSISSRSGAR